MSTKDRIALSFFSLIQQDFTFSVYRCPYHEGETRNTYPSCSRRRLPKEAIASGEGSTYSDYWVSFEQKAGFESFIANSFTNYPLTIDFLHYLLKQKCLSSLPENEFKFLEGSHTKAILFVLSSYPEGDQTLWLEPYFLKEVGKFGFLADFKFHASSPSKSSRRIQQLSLSLDKDSRSNKNFYADRFEKLQEFISRFYQRLFPLTLGLVEVSMHSTLVDLDSNALELKQYVFANDLTSNSQFNGVKDRGPLSDIKNGAKIYFMYREQDKPFSYDLYRALRGDTFSSTFPGMETMFRYKLNQENVGGKPIDGFDAESLEKALTSIKQDAGERPVVPILITPFNKNSGDESSRLYHIAKHTFLKYRIPSQFVSLALLQSKDQLKWSSSNIGLQLFAKMGGQPWKVSPKTKKCLIVGLGQAHQKVGNEIKKYFAYSVLTESTGLYKDLRTLSQTKDHGIYIRNFKENLKTIFEQYHDQYDSFVVHATFSIRRDELDAVKDVLSTMATSSASNKEFVAIKFNDKNKFFGYSMINNSMVPYESSFVRLSNREYLVWFEGLQYHNPNIRKRPERPLHVKFIYSSKDLTDPQMKNYLQDAINISGANWRGFNAKSLPVSVYYAYLVASYYKEFQSLNLDEINLEAINPWFL